MIDVFSDIPCALGESALWDGERLYWVDILGHRIYAKPWTGGDTAVLDTPGPVGAVALRGKGLVATLRHTIAFADIDEGTVESVAEVENAEENRLNDGAVDAQGRFWFGSMNLAEKDPTGAFYRLNPDLTVEKIFGGVTCSNGPAFSPDGSTLYHVDSTARRITAYTENGSRIFATDDDCFPDGLAVDAEGGVWNCKWDGSRVVRYAPDGTIDRIVKVPVERPTRCAFAGPDLDVLAITTAKVDRPLSGQVLLADPGTRGLAAHSFLG
ncbi:SMP-30/gluconolactonase/LRE family protein [Herbidospora galbida]|uniref:SMP-30/gluconolactonase/LRE family protein n=1 Tax=Herbidospora galbida TaxID=2575442 RepID=A0A4U3MHW6_9ACTN|nr:SMP-30/gluconolactonase/LRE family protein [Herbidospora galbida]TKK87577.1 SMP-30/gluconolactonase/LRE family protein [Herbidospora galbida]